MQCLNMAAAGLLFQLICGVLAAAAYAKSNAHVQPINAARYDNYRLYRIQLDNDEHVQIFQELEEKSDSCIFYGHARHPAQNVSVLVAAHRVADLTDLLDRFKVTHDILSYNFQDSIDKVFRNVMPKDTPASGMGWESFYHLQSILAWLDDLPSRYPNVEKLNIGTSHQGRPIRGVKISNGPGKPAVFIEGGIHAREWISPSTVTFIINQLLNSTDPSVQDIANYFDWFIIPVVNPDGYFFTFDGDRMWRKTRKPYGLCVGADLNRNFDFHWNGIGSSPDPCRYDYAGPHAHSEPEAAYLQDYIKQHRNSSRIETYVTMHSFSQLIMFPYGHTGEKCRNHDDLLAMGKKGIEAAAQRYGTTFQTGSIHDIIYPSTGSSMDWSYGVANVPVAFTIELRGPPDSSNMFLLPADEIIPVGSETFDALVAMLKEARRLGYYNGTNVHK